MLLYSPQGAQVRPKSELKE
uniref:Uncharacterized protein n=1 Tax=Arundo donax TaxID=35708 RepID=A0A0A9AL58_ARUDO